MATFLYAVRKFKREAKSWLTDDDYPAVVALEAMARELDEHMIPALLSQYGLTYRALLKRKPVANTGEVDPLDDIIPHN